MPDDRLRDSDVCAGLGQLGDLGEDGEVVLHRLRGDEAGVDAGEAAGAMAAHVNAVDVLPDPAPVGVVGVECGLLHLGQVTPQQELFGGQWHLC